MTLLGKVRAPSNNWQYLYYLLNPSSGSNNVVVTANSPHYLISQAASWYNVNAGSAAGCVYDKHGGGHKYVYYYVSDNCRHRGVGRARALVLRASGRGSGRKLRYLSIQRLMGQEFS